MMDDESFTEHWIAAHGMSIPMADDNERASAATRAAHAKLHAQHPDHQKHEHGDPRDVDRDYWTARVSSPKLRRRRA
jgi:hypothetical protein